ncbi:hypothetical protein [Bradyrhizobium sp. P5_C12]
MSGVNVIMAGALWRDLAARGVDGISFADCEAMIARMFDCARRIEAGTRDDEAPPRRCESSEVDLDGSCMACGAIQGEACKKSPRARS